MWVYGRSTSPEVFPITTFSEARRLPKTPWAAEGRARSQEEEPGALEKDPDKKHSVLASFRDLFVFEGTGRLGAPKGSCQVGSTISPYSGNLEVLVSRIHWFMWSCILMFKAAPWKPSKIER